MKGTLKPKEFAVHTTCLSTRADTKHHGAGEGAREGVNKDRLSMPYVTLAVRLFLDLPMLSASASLLIMWAGDSGS